MPENSGYRLYSFEIGLARMPQKYCAAGCQLVLEEPLNRDSVVTLYYPFAKGIIPGVVLIQEEGKPAQLILADGRGVWGPSPVEKQMLDETGGAILSACEQQMVVAIQDLPFVYRWLVTHAQATEEPIDSLFLNLYGELMPGNLLEPQFVKFLKMLDRQGQAREQLIFANEWARLASVPLRSSVQEYEKGVRPSDLSSLLQYQPLVACADRTLERELTALEFLGLFDNDFGVPVGALQSLGRQ